MKIAESVWLNLYIADNAKILMPPSTGFSGTQFSMLQNAWLNESEGPEKNITALK
jgi:hypothetical protein